MKRDTTTLDDRITKFMSRKLSQHPDIIEKRVRKITVRQRGRFFDDISALFKPAVRESF